MQRSEISEPRWANAPLTGIKFPNDSDNVRYRLMVSGSTLTVSVQVYEDANGATTLDYVYFGVAHDDGDRATCTGARAQGVRIRPATDSQIGRHVPLDTAASFRSFTYDAGAWNPAAGTAGRPSWIDVSSVPVALWNGAGNVSDGAAWAIQFRVDLTSLALGGAGSDRFFMGVHVDQGATLGANDYVTANTISGCTATCGTNPASTPAAFPVSPCDWTDLTSVSGSCSGVTISSNLIGGTTFTDASLVSVVPSAVNSFEVRPDYSTLTDPVSPNTVAARFRISNWGSVADSQAGWNDLLDSTQIANRPWVNNGGVGAIPLSCPNGGTGNNICGIVQASSIATAHHQCLQVEIRPASSFDPVPIAIGSTYRNMYYEGLSSTDQLAEISVRGLQALLSRHGPIYLPSVQARQSVVVR